MYRVGPLGMLVKFSQVFLISSINLFKIKHRLSFLIFTFLLKTRDHYFVCREVPLLSCLASFSKVCKKVRFKEPV